MLSSTFEKLLHTLNQPQFDQEKARGLGRQLLDQLEQASPEEGEQVLGKIAIGIAHPDPERSAFMTLVGGAIVENGFDSAPLEAALIERLEQEMRLAAKLIEACRETVRKSETEDLDQAFEQAYQLVSPNMPRQAQAFDALNALYRAGVTVFSFSKSARAKARGLLEYSGDIAEFHQGAYWLNHLLQVLDDEPLLVIEPSSGLGFSAQMSGISDNFQLHMLLMDIFPGATAPRIPAPQAAVAWGRGPQQLEDTVNGQWNLYDWRAVNHKRGLSESVAQAAWIWGEGIPADILVFEGQRVVLLGKPSYQRGWQASRMFSYLEPEIDQMRELPQTEVAGWLERMFRANA